MESRCPVNSFTHPDWVGMATRHDLSLSADTSNNGSANENCLKRRRIQFRRLADFAMAVHLPAVCVSPDADVDQPQAELARVFHLSGQQDGAGAGPKDWTLPPKIE